MSHSNETLLSLLGSDFKWVSGEHKGPCWKCGGRDRFWVKDGIGHCRQCQWNGDAIQLLRERDGLSFTEAAAQVGREIEHKPAQPKKRPAKPAMRASIPKEVDFDQQAWGRMAHKLMHRAMEILCTTSEGKEAESYLRDARGLSITALDGAFLGYIPTRFETVWGGLNVTVERGISIPWFGEHTHAHKVNVRTENPDKAKRYKAVTGSVNGAYMVHRVRPGDFVVLVEGEIDALSVLSATDFKVCGVATGSTMGGRLLSVVAKLALARRVFVAFDTDEPGEQAAQWWLQALPNSKRLTPTRHDVNDMLVQDGPDSIIEWIRGALEKAAPQPAQPMQPQRIERPAPITPPAPVALPKPGKLILPGMGSNSAYHHGGL